ncbi:hypothetical protein [uncultured Tenacibaculum sp.]|uniref:hypothetical protein n=1 Tax=uncultured Tenacibaculum sp. TaxID=174713 RepID=UPI0026186235|nr:hypothetical protein [uncultured Tenacibaculum sp.]
MKRIFIFLFTVVTLNSFSQVNQLNVGVNGGITVGNLEAVSSAAFGVDANYLFEIYEGISVGPSLNLLYFLTEDNNGVKPDPFIYLPVGGAVRFQSLSDVFYVGADFGFAVGLSPDGDNGGIFFKPMLGYNINESLKLNLFYSGVKKKLPTYGYVGLGITFDFLGSSNYYGY